MLILWVSTGMIKKRALGCAILASWLPLDSQPTVHILSHHCAIAVDITWRQPRPHDGLDELAEFAPRFSRGLAAFG